MNIYPMWSWPVLGKQLGNFIDGKITWQEADVSVQDVTQNLYKIQTRLKYATEGYLTNRDHATHAVYNVYFYNCQQAWLKSAGMSAAVM